MATEQSDITLFRIDPAKNMRRYYSMTIQPILFGGHSLMRSWGRIGSGGQQQIDFYDKAECAVDAHNQLLESKRKRGYSLQTTQFDTEKPADIPEYYC